MGLGLGTRVCVHTFIHTRTHTYRCRRGSEGAAVGALVPASKSTTSSTVGRRSGAAPEAEAGVATVAAGVVAAVWAAASPPPFIVGAADAGAGAGARGGAGTLSLATAAQLENCFCGEWRGNVYTCEFYRLILTSEEMTMAYLGRGHRGRSRHGFRRRRLGGLRGRRALLLRPRRRGRGRRCRPLRRRSTIVLGRSRHRQPAYSHRRVLHRRVRSRLLLRLLRLGYRLLPCRRRLLLLLLLPWRWALGTGSASPLGRLRL